MKIALIANPKSGGSKGKKQVPMMVEFLEKNNIEYDLFLTLRHEHGIEIAGALDVKQYDRIYSAGGDGTNYHVINGLLKNNNPEDIPPLGIIPAGSGNSFVRDLGISSTEEGLETLLRNNVRSVDVLSFNTGNEEYYFVNLTGLGFVTDVAETASRFKYLGDFSYVIGVFHRLIRLNFHDMELVIDGVSIEGKNCFVEFCNSRFTGGAMLMAPEAEIDDGLFDVVILSKISRLGLIKTFPKIFRGTHVDHPAVQVIRGKHAEIKTLPAKTLLPDGELFGKTPTEIKTYPQYVRYSV